MLEITGKKFAVVTWEDSFYDDSFHKDAELEHEAESYLIHSVGWLIRETPIIVTIAMDFEGSDGGSYREVKRIRKENIRSLRIIEVAAISAPPSGNTGA